MREITKFRIYVVIAIAGMLGVTISISYIVNVLLTNKIITDITNYPSLIISTGIGIIITVIVFIYSDKQQSTMLDLLEKTKNQQGKISELVTKIKELSEKQQEILKEQANLLRDKREIYADGIVSWIDDIIEEKSRIDKLYFELFQNAPNSRVKDSTRKNIINSYMHYLQVLRPSLKPLDLVDIFGKPTATLWNKVDIKCRIAAQLYQPEDDEGMERLMNAYTKCVDFAKDMRTNLMRYTSSEISHRSGTSQYYNQPV